MGEKKSGHIAHSEKWIFAREYDKSPSLLQEGQQDKFGQSHRQVAIEKLAH
jgi:hypothetical protein